MRPPLRLGEFAMPKYEIITLPETHPSAPRRATPVPRADIRVPPSDARSVLARILSHAPAIPPILYGLNETYPSQKKTTSRKCSIPRR